MKVPLNTPAECGIQKVWFETTRADPANQKQYSGYCVRVCVFVSCVFASRRAIKYNGVKHFE